MFKINICGKLVGVTLRVLKQEIKCVTCILPICSAASFRSFAGTYGLPTASSHFINNDTLTLLRYTDDAVDLVYKSLNAVYNCNINEIREMTETVPELKVANKHVQENATYLKKQRIKKDVLISHPWILTYKPSTLTFGFQCLHNFHQDINIAIPLLQIPLKRLMSLSNIAAHESSVIQGGNRINFLSNFLQCEPAVISKAMVKYQFLLTVPSERLCRNMDLLKEAGVPPQSILKDLWVFRYNPEIVQLRFTEAKEAGLAIIRPWFVRCPEETFNRMIKKHVETKKELGKHISTKSYLSGRLGCSEETIELMNRRTPQMLSSSIPRLKEMIDFLLNEGFSSNEICNAPRVFNRKTKLLQTRLTELRNLGCNRIFLPMLCRSKREYERLIRIIKRSRARK